MDANYIRTTEEDRLAEYVKAIDLLTIDPTNRLRQENHDLKMVQAQKIAEQDQEIDRLKTDMHQYKQFYVNISSKIEELVEKYKERKRLEERVAEERKGLEEERKRLGLLKD